MIVGRCADLPPRPADTEDGVAGREGPHRVDISDADVLGNPIGEGDAAGIDDIVDHHGGDDLAAQLVVADLGHEVIAQLSREILWQPGRERLLIGKIAGQHLLLERKLDVGHQGGQFR